MVASISMHMWEPGRICKALWVSGWMGVVVAGGRVWCVTLAVEIIFAIFVCRVFKGGNMRGLKSPLDGWCCMVMRMKMDVRDASRKVYLARPQISRVEALAGSGDFSSDAGLPLR